MSEQKTHSAIFDDIAQPLVCIMGPTASGKTALAFELADHVRAQGRDVDIISVDSALVYRDMNIGTAKPTSQELAAYPHALVDIIDPTQSYSAAEFTSDARELIMKSQSAGRLPVLVGGTMLYYQALFGGLNRIPASVPEVRAALTERLKHDGIASLYKVLQKIDPVVASKLQAADTQRVLRALEVYEVSGKPMSSFQQAQDEVITLPSCWKVVGLIPERSWLHERIALRLNLMWQDGFLEEVLNVLQTYELHADLPSMRAVGYRQVWDYLHFTEMSEGDKLDMQNKALFATRQLAKRQYTWLRKLQKKYQMEMFVEHSQAKKHLLKSKLW